MAGEALTDIDKMIAAAEKFGDKLPQLATQYGPDVADVADVELLAARVDAASGIVAGVASVAAAVAFAFALRYSIREHSDAVGDEERCSRDEEIPWFFAMIGSGLGAAFASIIGAAMLLNVWRWVGIFEPKVWLAGKLLGWM